ncbi:MAG: OmpH family outer membrane protein [Pseudomonadales bacterium]|jgi:outer membrane protein|nr:OmpH family outer membrane protein [Pseudomonadales bacterium]
MIKKIAVLLSAFCIASAAQAEMKIVVLDTVRAILETEEAKVLIEAAGREMEPEQTEVQGLAEQRQGLIDKVRKDGEVMSNSEQAQIQKDIEAIEIDLQFLSQKLQKTVQDKRQEILVALAPKFEKVRNDLIQIEGFDMIAAPNALVYVNPKNDITKKITERMNEQSD